jgi:hypothetical protein
MKRFIFFFILFLLSLRGFEVNGKDSLFYKEVNLIIGYNDKKEILDKTKALKNCLGFEYFGKFSKEDKDLYTLNLQIRLGYDFKRRKKKALSFEVHNAWIEYNLSLGNIIRIGHFDPSFGLEPVVDTHGSLLQSLAYKSIGFKKDWGFSFKTFQKDYELESSLTLGSGMEIKSIEGGFLFTSRIERKIGEELNIGLSLLYGNILKKEAKTTSLKREIALDGRYEYFPYSFKVELCFGKEDKEEISGVLIDIDYIPYFIHQDLELGFQSIYWEKDLDFNLCLSYKILPSLKSSFGYFGKEKALYLQLYYYGR